MKIPANGFTHAGKFHADDVFATALLQILRPVSYTHLTLPTIA